MAYIEIDHRGLEPQEPVVRTLDALAQLEGGDELTVLLDDEPLLLYPELERRGYDWKVEHRDGFLALRIREEGADE